MIQSLKRVLSALLVFVMVASVCAGVLPIQAEAKTGTLVSNTGTRHESCTSLSDQALDYYTGQYSWDILSSTPGGTTNCADTDDNQLYQLLHDLMSSTHTKTVSYKGNGGLQTYWPKTDSSSQVPSTYVFFYSDVKGDGTMNREHVWPKSHGTFYESGAGSDLHHLRPTNATVNSTRSSYTMGNVRGVISGYRTYTYSGKDVLYYSPSDYLVEINDNIKGDVARIFLYVWCRWEQPNLFQNTGSTGSGNDESDGEKVIESLDTLLQWMELDPVDEWEMGRNDQVENVQGNRNVFIDYPELAWKIFGLDVPENLSTPSGGGSATCTHEQATHHAAVAPTCTSDGTVEYWQCNSCRQYFSDAACTSRIYTITAKATGHHFVNGTCSGCGLEQSSAAAGSYVKVTSARSDWSGTYLIGYESGSEAKILTDNGKIGSANNCSTLSVSSGQITSGITDEMIVTISKNANGTYSLQINGKYFGNNYSAQNALDTSLNAATYTSNITWDSGSAKIVSTTGGSVLRWNDSSNCFKFYKSTTYTYQKPIVLYKLAGESSTPTPTPTPVETVTAELVTKPQDGSTVYLFNPGSGSTVTAESYVYNGTKKELALTSGTVSGTKLTTPTTACLFTVHVDSNGYYTFQTKDGKYLSADGTNVELVSSTGQYTIFQLEQAADGWYIHSVNAESNSQKNQYLQIYSGYLTVFGFKSDNASTFAFRFYSPDDAGGSTPACTHKNAAHTAAKAATCTQSGNREYWHCASCGKYFSDSACTKELAADKLSIAAKGHSGVHVSAKAPTCTKDGNKEYWSCSTCGKLFSDSNCKTEITQAKTVDPATGHKWKSATCLHGKICTVCGKEEGSKDPTNHEQDGCYRSVDDNVHQMYHACCNSWSGEKIRHNLVSDASGKKYCSDCGYGCSHAKTELRNASSATCTTSGYTGDKCCTVCGQKVESGSVIPATGHKDQNHDHICDVTGCGATVGEHKGAAGSHICSYCGKTASECTDGNGDHKCDICGSKMNSTDPVNPTDPEPTQPDPTNPDPTDPQPTDPEPTNPDPTDPQPTDPDPSEPANPTQPDESTPAEDPLPSQGKDPADETLPNGNGQSDNSVHACDNHGWIIWVVVIVVICVAGVVIFLLLKKKKQQDEQQS